VRPVIANFQEDVRKCHELLGAVRSARLPFFQIELFAELSFLRMYVSWESFLEESFSRFLCGARTISGTRPASCARPRSIDHAKSLLIGLERGGRYADWSKRDTVVTRAQLFFRHGAPFAGPLTAAARDLDDMRLIRDCIAHRSRTAKDNLAKLVHRRTGAAHKYSPGRFLLKTVTGTPATYLELFSRTLSLTAHQISA
jgi:hypothetical protein